MNAKLLFLTVFAATFANAEDIRVKAPKDLNGYFPFNPPSSLSEWDARRDYVRRQILVAEGLWPMPTKTPLNAVVHGKVEGEGFTVEKVYFESAPGFFVTGSLWKPKVIKGKVPGVMFAHGHWKDARLSIETDAKVRAEIAAGGERFERGGKSIFQSLCVQLARMGCVVWQWDMLSDSDSVQIPREIVHTFAKQRPEMNTAENWGLYSPQAEAHLQSIMGLQTWNAVRGLDFLLSLPEVDPERTAITGASGGGTQTMLLAAIDDRIKLSFPCVMVSTAMQGGCTCENTSLLRINTGNVEFAGLFAPKPQGMNTANDWTKEMATKGFPDLQKLYTTFGKKDNVFLLRGEHFPHNYNAVTRSAFYTFVNKHFKLGLEAPVIEQDYEPLTREQLTVWDEKHPAPKAADPEFERKLLKYFTSDAEKRLSGDPQVLREGIEVIMGRTYDKAGEVEWTLKDKQDRGDHLEMTGTLTNKTYGEELDVAWLYPKEWNGRVVIWLDDAGKSGLANAQVKELVKGGAAVLGVDLLFQGTELAKQNRLVANPREFAGYTYGYNNALFAQRTHDVLTLTSFLRNTKVGTHPSPKSVCIAALGEQTGPIAVAACALAGEHVDRAAVDTHGFRFGKVLDYRDPMFLPGGAKYRDLPGMLSLYDPNRRWVKGGERGDAEGSAVEWLLK